jgi:hypothetical protein
VAILPAYGEWHLSNPLFSANPPFAVLSVDFLRRTGTARYLHNTTDLSTVTRLAPDKFGAKYAVGASRGLFEAQIDNDQLLAMKFIGSVNTTCTARPVEGRIFGMVRVVSAMSNAEKLGEAMRRALPLLPADVAAQVEALLTPESLAIMAGVTVVWGVSHFFGVGEVADAILLVVGAAVLGATAVDVARDLMGFVQNALGAKSEADLDKAAAHFAQAVIKGGITVIMAILLHRGAKATQEQLNARFARGAPPRPAIGPRVPGTAGTARLPPQLEPLRDPIAAARAATADCEGQAMALEKSLGGGRVPGVERVGVNPHGMTTAGGEVIDHAWANVRMGGVDYVLDTSAAQYIEGSPFCSTAPLVQPQQIIGAGLADAVETGVFTRQQHQTFLSLLQRSLVRRRPF